MRRRGPLLALGLLVTLLLGPTAAPVRGQARCQVTGERQMIVLEPRPVQYGGEVDVTVLLDIDCGPDARSVVLTLTEAIPTALRHQPGIGTAPDTAAADGLTWRIPDATGRILVPYRVFVLPDPTELAARGRIELQWPMGLSLAVDGRTETPAPPPVDPLVIEPRPGARGCDLDARMETQPETVAIGEPFSATLSLRFDRCRYPGPRQRAILALQPVASADEADEQAAAARALAAEIHRYQPGQPGMVGVVGNRVDGPPAWAPTADTTLVNERVDAIGPGPADTPDRALTRALGVLEDWPGHHETVYLLADGAGPLANPAAWRQAVAAAAAREVDVVVVCAGACDPTLTPELTLTAWSSLRFRTEALVAAHLGEPMAVEPVTVVSELQDYLALVPGSARPPASLEPWGLQWSGLSVLPGETLSVSFRATIDRWGRFPIGASGRAIVDDAEGRGSAGLLLLPGFVTVRKPPDDGQPCRAEVAKSASPARIPLGDTTAVTLELRPECQELEDRTHIVLSLDRSGSMGYGIEFSYVKLAAKALGDMLAVDGSSGRRFGMVSHGDPPEIAVPLTNDPDEIQRRIDAVVARGQDNLAASIAVGADMLRAGRALGPPPTDEILVVLSDGGQTYPPRDALPAAEAAKADGIVVVAVCAQSSSSDCETMRQVASGPDNYFEVERIDGALERFVQLGLQLRQVRIAEAVITDDLPPHVQLVPGSAQPAPESGGDGRLVWRFPLPSPAGVSARYEIRPILTGRLPTNVWADASFVDIRGRRGYRVFPIPFVEAYAGPPFGPCHTTVTARGVPGEVAVFEPITQSLAVAMDCPPRPVPLDTVLAIDHSSSMGTFSRLENAKAAAHAFLDALDPSRAWVGLVAFSGAVSESAPLTPDYGLLRSAIDRLVPNGQTNLAGALREAHALFRDRRPDTNAAIVLLTDGKTDGAIEPVILAADEAKADGILVLTFCAGDCDPELSRVASRPELAVTVTDSAQLVALYAELARELANDRAREVSIEHLLPDAMQALPGAARPVPQEGPVDGRTTWRFDRVPEDGITVTLGTRPLRAGDVPLGQVWVTYRYGPQGYGHGRFPLGTVRVRGLEPPTPTPLVTPTPTATPTPRLTVTDEPPPDRTPDGPRPALFLPSVSPGTR